MKDSAIDDNWADVRKEFYNPEEIVGSDLRVVLIGKLIKVHQENGISQKRLEELISERIVLAE